MALDHRRLSHLVLLHAPLRRGRIRSQLDGQNSAEARNADPVQATVLALLELGSILFLGLIGRIVLREPDEQVSVESDLRPGVAEKLHRRLLRQAFRGIAPEKVGSPFNLIHDPLSRGLRPRPQF